MTEEKLELTPTCALVLVTCTNCDIKQVSLEYTEHSQDHWHSDSETSIDLDADNAKDIIAFLHKAFPELAPAAPVQEPVRELTPMQRESVAWLRKEAESEDYFGRKLNAKRFDDAANFIEQTPPAAQPAVPLTDEQREEIAKGWRGRNWTVGDIIDAVEAAHGITEKGGAA